VPQATKTWEFRLAWSDQWHGGRPLQCPGGRNVEASVNGDVVACCGQVCSMSRQSRFFSSEPFPCSDQAASDGPPSGPCRIHLNATTSTPRFTSLAANATPSTPLFNPMEPWTNKTTRILDTCLPAALLWLVWLQQQGFWSPSKTILSICRSVGFRQHNQTNQGDDVCKTRHATKNCARTKLCPIKNVQDKRRHSSQISWRMRSWIIGFFSGSAEADFPHRRVISSPCFMRLSI